MPSSKNLKHLQAVTYLHNKLTFTLFPIVFRSHDQTFNIFIENSKKRNALLAISIINMVYITVQFIFELRSYNKSNLIQLLFQGFLFFVYIGIWIFKLGYYRRATEFCALMNCLVKNPGGLLDKREFHLRQHDNIFKLINVFSQLISFTLLLVFFPLADISFTIYAPNISINYKVGLVLFTVLRTPSFLFACLVGMLSFSISFITVKELSDNLKDLQEMQIKSFKKNCNINDIWVLGQQYRKIQIFAIMTNTCFQMYFWPVIQFIGAIVSIGLLYTL